MRMLRGWSGRGLGIGMTLAAAALSGCADTSGVDVQNKTGEVLRVEWLDVTATGTTVPYSTATLARGATFRHTTDEDRRGFGKRVRFTLADRPEAAEPVVLHLPDGSTREFDVYLVDGRLVARPIDKGRAYGK